MFAEPLALRRLCVVTSAFHMARARAIFGWVFALDDAHFELQCLETEDVGMDGTMLAARRKGEAESLRVLEDVTKRRVRNMSELTAFVFQEHSAYSAAGVAKRVEEPDSVIRSTY